MSVIGWLVALIAFTGIEIATMALTTIWFAGGSLAALILCLAGAGLELQLAAFAVVSFILLILTRPLALQYVNRKTKKTNVESLIGRQARITETVNNANGTGTAVVNGQEWTARAEEDGQEIPAGTQVEIRKIRGVKLIVAPLPSVEGKNGGKAEKGETKI